jgi:hypothetical protein
MPPDARRGLRADHCQRRTAVARVRRVISHAAEITPDGVTVTEVWEARKQWERWFNASVRPHLLADAPEPTVTELHNALGR